MPSSSPPSGPKPTPPATRTDSGGKSAPLGSATGSGPKHAPASQAPRPQGAELLAELMQAQRQFTVAMHEVRELRAKLNRRSHQMQVLQHVS